MNKFTILILLLITIAGAQAADDQLHGLGGEDGNRNMPSQTSGSFDQTLNEYSFTNSVGFGSNTGVHADDFNGDGNTEIIIQDGGFLNLYSNALALTDGIANAWNGHVGYVPSACSSNPGIVAYTGASIRLYCVSSTALNIQSTYSTNISTVSGTGLNCNEGYCFLATDEGFYSCNATTSTLSCSHHAQQNIGNRSEAQIPAIEDLDGDGLQDAVFYIVDDAGLNDLGIFSFDGTVMNKNVSASAITNDDGVQNPPVILTNNYVGGTYPSTSGYGFFDIFGTLQWSTTYTQESFSQSYLGRPITADIDGDGSSAEVCFSYSDKHDEIGEINDVRYCKILCFSSSGTYLKGITTASQSGVDPGTAICPSYYLGVGDINTDTGEEILTVSKSGSTNDNIRVHNMDSGTTYTGYAFYSTTTNDLRPYTADINGDGQLDVLFTKSGFTSLYSSSELPPPPTNNAPDVLSQTLVITRDPSDGYPMYVNTSFTALDDEGDNLTCITFRDYNSTLTSGHSINDLSHIDAAQYHITTSPDGIVGNTDSKWQFTYNTSDEAYQIRSYCADGNHTDFADMDYEQDYFIAYNSLTTTDDMTIVVRDATTNALISNAVVDIVDYQRAGQSKVVQLTESGQTTFYDIPLAAYFINVGHPSYISEDIVCQSYQTCTAYLELNLVDNLFFTVRDSQSFSLISGVNATIVSYVNEETHSTITNSTGQAYFRNITQGQYLATFSRNGYNDYSNFYNTGGANNVVYMQGSSTGDTTATVTVRDINTAQPIFGAYIFMIDIYQQGYYYGFTDENGQAEFYDLTGNSNYEIEISFNGVTQTFNGFMVQGQHNELEFLFGEELVSKYGYNNTEDIIKGIWISGVNKIKCDVDSQCPTDKCNVMGTCSSFNYSYCDANARPRNQRCVLAGTFKGAMSAVADWMLSNFLWMILIIILLVLFLMLMIGIRRR